MSNSGTTRMPRSRAYWMTLGDLLLRVVEAVRALFLQKRIDLAFDRETLVIGEVPVEDIELYRFHAVEVALDYWDRLEMAAGIDHQAAPGKARFIINRGGRRGKTLRSNANQLQESLQAVEDAQRIRSRQLHAVCRHFQVIGLIFAQLLDRLACAGSLDGEVGRTSPVRRA